MSELPKRGDKFDDLVFRRVATKEEEEADRKRRREAGHHQDSRGRLWLMKCKCGREVFMCASDIRRKRSTKSCGCRLHASWPDKRRADHAARMRKDETGKEHGWYKVVRLAPPEGTARRETGRSYQRGARWIVECKFCGDQLVRRGCVIREGVSCHCVRYENRTAANAKDLTGMRWEGSFIELLRIATNEERKRSTWTTKDTAYWLCKCHNCGRDDVVLPPSL